MISYVAKKGKGKTLYIQLSIYPNSPNTEKNLTISCPDKNTKFKTSLTNPGLGKFREYILKFYKGMVVAPQTRKKKAQAFKPSLRLALNTARASAGAKAEAAY